MLKLFCNPRLFASDDICWELIMKVLSSKLNILSKCGIAAVSAFLSLAITHAANAGAPVQKPLFLDSAVIPIMMLNMSRDHQFFFKLYDDYTDIIGDATPETTYAHDYNYYGYFDSNKCYVYNTTSKIFEPKKYTDNRYCNASSAVGEWSGNFLNWASMTRIDAVRKILYGGYRSTDTVGSTVLERSLLPNDAHSFAKYYAGADLHQLTPFAANDTDSDIKKRGITLCNTTSISTKTQRTNALSHSVSTVDAPPVFKVARGNYSLWASHGGFECLWEDDATIVSTDDIVADNGNIEAASGISAYTTKPSMSGSGAQKLMYPTTSSLTEFNVRVAVCSDETLINAPVAYPESKKNNEKCRLYGTKYKPAGLLQEYATQINFGLLTGAYSKNKSGGVLRKSVGSIANEVNADGVFIVPGNGQSIIKTLDLLRIYGYRFKDGRYFEEGQTSADNCKWGKYSFSDGECSNWGNPQAEIYLESLRYLAGKTSPKFDAVDSSRITGLNAVNTTWVDPITPAPAGNYCAPLNILQFNSSTTSYDDDQLTSSYDDIFASGGITTATDLIGSTEGIHGNTYFVGETATQKNQLCTPKTVSNLSAVQGICPESPRLDGGYNIAGLAYLARSTGIGAGREKVKTFGVALSPAVPKVVIPVPGDATKKITLLPACRADEGTDKKGNCAIVDFKVVNPVVTPTTATGKLYVNWEDSEQGGDYDQDMWGVIDYSVASTGAVTIGTQVLSQSAAPPMGFGYVISGTVEAGAFFHSGINHFTSESLCTTAKPCVCLAGDNNSNDGNAWKGSCDSSKGARSEKSFTAGASTAKSLESPLYYAAKWGGWDDIAATTTTKRARTAAEIKDISIPETYFYATDPWKLEQSLRKALSDAAGTVGSAATVAANSTQLNTDTLVFQARFDSNDWSGQILAYKLNTDGTVNKTSGPDWDTSVGLTRASTRKIFTYDGATSKSLVKLSTWSGSAVPNLKAALQLGTESTDANAQKRFNWLLGSAADESDTSLRKRTKILGDIVNSDLAFAGGSTQRFNLLPAKYGAASYLSYVETKKARKSAVFVGANDGMLHAFQAMGADKGKELFAYIPRGAYAKLANLSKPNYQHEYVVDGPVYVSDVYFDSDNDGVGGEWRTIVAGTLGAGGRGAYALDVTNVLSGTGDPIVIFDLTAEDSTLPSYRNDLGYGTGKVMVVPTHTGNWAAIFGNGNNSETGIAKLFAIDIENPSTYKVIDTKSMIGSTKDNGLSGVAILPNGEGVATYAYAGDIAGNMWKFDLAGSTVSSWKVAYGDTTTPKPLINVLDPSNVAQPITSTPTLGKNSLKQNSGIDSTMVYFGTGKYYETTDKTALQIQSIYGIADNGAAIALSSNTDRLSKLHQKTISAESASARTISNDKTPTSGVPAVTWASKNGWFLDLKLTSGSAKGERVLTKPLLMFDRLILTTFIPSTNQCDYGGSGWLMELTGVGDKYIGHSVLGNKANTLLTSVVIGDLIPMVAGEKVILLGSELGRKDKDSELISIIGNAGGGSRGRMSWQQIK